jgi:hypothetical protein
LTAGLPEPTPLVVTEHRAHDCRCAACGTHSRAGFPLSVNAPVQYGPRIAAVVTYLLHYQLLPEDRLVELMADLIGVRIAAATIARISRSCAARLQDFVAAVRDRVGASRRTKMTKPVVLSRHFGRVYSAVPETTPKSPAKRDPAIPETVPIAGNLVIPG